MNIRHIPSEVRKGILEDIVTALTKNHIEFDKNPYLFAFTNCVFDLKKGDFIKPKATDYISKTAGYAYQKSTAEQLNALNSLLDTVFPNPEINKNTK